MSDDEADPELLEFLRQHLSSKLNIQPEADTGVLEGAEYVCDESIDVALDMRATKNAAALIHARMQETSYSAASWSNHELHPKAEDGEQTAAFIFVMDLLNFSFWSELSEEKRFAVEYRGKKWTGYWSLVAALRRAIDEDIPILDPHYWHDEEQCNMESMRYVFRSCTDEEMPLLEERLGCLKEAAEVLYQKHTCSIPALLASASNSAAQLVNTLASDFACFRDQHPFDGRRRPVRFLKRAQILAADLWACFRGASYGAFPDIDRLTIFADYRIPQILATLGCIAYSPPLMSLVSRRLVVESGSRFEVQLRASSIWCVELIRREIKREHPEAEVNAVLLDFFLYDMMKDVEAAGKETMPHHRTRSIWY